MAWLDILVLNLIIYTMADLDGAFNKIERKNFLPSYEVSNAHFDVPIPIGFGQTNSQPSTVYLMLEWLEPDLGDKVLDVGSGSGWTTALLACLVGNKGSVFGVERIKELVEFGRENCKRLDIRNAKFYLAGNEFGLKKYAPYDRILVSASYDEIPKSLIYQLKIGGKMVIPVNNDILEITKLSDNSLDIITHPGFVFVPLIRGVD